PEARWYAAWCAPVPSSAHPPHEYQAHHPEQESRNPRRKFRHNHAAGTNGTCELDEEEKEDGSAEAYPDTICGTATLRTRGKGCSEQCDDHAGNRNCKLQHSSNTQLVSIAARSFQRRDVITQVVVRQLLGIALVRQQVSRSDVHPPGERRVELHGEVCPGVRNHMKISVSQQPAALPVVFPCVCGEYIAGELGTAAASFQLQSLQRFIASVQLRDLVHPSAIASDCEIEPL